MKYIDIDRLNGRLDKLKEEFHSKKVFKYLMFDNFFSDEVAEEILKCYPTIEDGKWDGITYLDQKNKFQKNKFEEGSVLDVVFKEFNSIEFLNWLQDLTELDDNLIGDDELFGGGLHQSIKGAFLNVHVDYNIHPKTKCHRRLNVIVYMNKDWKDEYEGHLELWDLTDNKKELIDKYAPSFNRCVIFETNEVSFHGHPKKLNTPFGVNRKSLATYFYTKNRPSSEVAEEHNTIYVNTEGATGKVKRFKSGVKAMLERINK